jgi:Alginate lyase
LSGVDDRREGAAVRQRLWFFATTTRALVTMATAVALAAAVAVTVTVAVLGHDGTPAGSRADTARQPAPVDATTPAVPGTATPSPSGASPGATASHSPAATRPPAPGGAAGTPAAVLNLTNWKLTLPVAGSGSGDAREVTQPQLGSFALSPWFAVDAAGDGVVFQANAGGATTSGSSYPRSELREMTGAGAQNASWSSTSGTHTMVISEAITALPSVKPHVVAGQIHDADDDVAVFRLEGSSLYLTHGDDSHYKLITSSYRLGTRFEAKFVVSGGKVAAYYNGVLQASIADSFSGGYFKAGCYTQSNTDKGDAPGAYGQVIVFGLTVTHS